jgi:PEP-CTERM motif-containing protein
VEVPEPASFVYAIIGVALAITARRKVNAKTREYCGR